MHACVFVCVFVCLCAYAPVGTHARVSVCVSVSLCLCASVCNDMIVSVSLYVHCMCRNSLTYAHLSVDITQYLYRCVYGCSHAYLAICTY